MRATPANEWFANAKCRYIPPGAPDLDVFADRSRSGAVSGVCSGRAVTPFVQSFAGAGKNVTYRDSTDLNNPGPGLYRAAAGR